MARSLVDLADVVGVCRDQIRSEILAATKGASVTRRVARARQSAASEILGRVNKLRKWRNAET